MRTDTEEPEGEELSEREQDPLSEAEDEPDPADTEATPTQDLIKKIEKSEKHTPSLTVCSVSIISTNQMDLGLNQHPKAYQH